MAHKIDSLKKRYFFKLSSNIFGQGLGVVIQAIVARGLGPRAYGDFNLLGNFFTQVMGFFDMGTSTAFYIKLSQRIQQTKIVVFYRYYAFIASFLVFGFVMAAQALSAYPAIWPEQKLSYIYLGAAFGVITWLVGILNKMVDAYALTVSAEIARAAQKFIGLLIIVGLYLFNILNLRNYFFYQYITLAVLSLLFIVVMERAGYPVIKMCRLSLSDARVYLKDFYDYSHPLFTAITFGAIISIFDRWLLQVFGGSIQQGFFGLSYQIGLACIMFTSAMTPLFMREFSIAFGEKDMERMRYLFHKHIPLLYSITAFISCFLATQAGIVIQIMGGAKYGAAITAVTIMALYPIHQTYGQLSGSLIFAAGQTRLFRNMEIIFSIFGLCMSYILLAPRQYYGLGAGATGLALKMVIVQFIYVNVLLFFNTRLLKFSFWAYFRHQILCVFFLITAGIVAKFAAYAVIPLHNSIFVFISSGIIYLLIAMTMLCARPGLFGIDRAMVNEIGSRVGNIGKRR